jgi:preprotein translocase subunit SecE
VARNRKRAKERRARRPQPVGTGRPEQDEAAPAPIRHAAPDVELAEAQMAVGRPELAEENEADEQEFELEAEEAAQADQAATASEGHDDDEARDDDEDDEGRDGAGRANGVALAGEAPVTSAGELAPTHGPAAPAERRHHGNRLINFLIGSWRELQRVQWPDRRQVIQATGVVIGFVIVAGVFLGVADTLAAKLMNYILNQ